MKIKLETLLGNEISLFKVITATMSVIISAEQ